jgi:predicted hotdog family 3-hydroxylacyl-ACP dehydratase
VALSLDVPIEQLVPHRGPMLLVDRLLDDDPESVRAEAVVKPTGLFHAEQGMPAWTGIELMAQTIAAWAGVQRLKSGGTVKLGFLLGSRRYEATQPFFPVGARLVIEARQELVAENGLAVFDCRIVLDGNVIATAHLNVFQPEDVDQYLKGAQHG